MTPVQPTAPRISPGSLRDIGLLNAALARLLGRLAGTNPPNLFTTLGRHRRLFRRWLFFASALMPGGRLPRTETELVILRVAHNGSCSYEWSHHLNLGRRAGLTQADLERVPTGPSAEGWTDRQRLLLTAADELHADRVIGELTWTALSKHLSQPDLLELCMLIGHYEMLAMTLNTIRVQPDVRLH